MKNEELKIKTLTINDFRLQIRGYLKAAITIGGGVILTIREEYP